MDSDAGKKMIDTVKMIVAASMMEVIMKILDLMQNKELKIMKFLNLMEQNQHMLTTTHTRKSLYSSP